MARKTKPISKQPKPVKASEPEQDDGQIFSQSFKDRLDQYASLSKEVEGSNPNKQIKERRERVSERIQGASTTILKEELGSLEEWIVEQQKNLVEQINLIKGAYDENRKNLESTNAFTKEEIESQLEALQKRADERQAIHDNYGVLLERSKNIYKQ